MAIGKEEEKPESPQSSTGQPPLSFNELVGSREGQPLRSFDEIVGSALAGTDLMEVALSVRAQETAWPVSTPPWEKDREASDCPVILVLGTGGTIASMTRSLDEADFEPGYVPIDDLIDEVRPYLPANVRVAGDQILQGLKDVGDWQRLVRDLGWWMCEKYVDGIVVASGTDVLEETAYLLFRLFSSVRSKKPVVLTAAMRPHSAVSPDGPRNLRDAILVAATPGAHGVCVAMNGVVLAADGLRKIDTERLDAFWSPDGPIATISARGEPTVDVHGLWPACGATFPIEMLEVGVGAWPSVQIVKDCVGASGALIELARREGLLHGLVVEASGAGTMRVGLEKSVQRTIQAGIPTVITSRTAYGKVHARPPFDMLAGKLSAVQARVAVMLELIYVYWLINFGVFNYRHGMP